MIDVTLSIGVGEIYGETVPDWSEPAVGDFPCFDYSNKDVRRAGEVISSGTPWTAETDSKIRDAFKVANSWRDAHAFPMRSVRCSVMSHMWHREIKGITAARLKRMPAIRRKLNRIGLGLNQIQDLGGCRAILDTMDDVRLLVQTLQDKIRHEVRSENNYIEAPKPDGYRSHHIILGFKGRDDEQAVFDGRRIELQIRTRMQHAWATAVEAVGLFRGEELKNHAGSPEWLRLFALMSGEIAEAEGCPVNAAWSDRDKRRSEIRDLANKLDAITFLENVRHSVNGTDFVLAPGYAPSHFMLRYDHLTKTVTVQPFNRPISATQSYDEAEGINRKDETENIVLVEVSKIDNLKAAYPNYFGDVGFFETELKRAVSGEDVREYGRVAVTRKPWTPEPSGDPQSLRYRPFPRPDSNLRKPKNRRPK
jgi:ppGpp synthetase/RelA/SpoT-type nucleotidyltranferase